ncbi:Phosphopantothenate--cysteine ligase cab2 [Mycoemilia scoparia]|uniref:Phosphopantothenate--cysteine ligase cab2 n=1 Tax=Mycoemilia scoparia TaxID=417184 RepID=A0A9W7ZXC3_9FUNG|nr:Phosphopantothenate--cysteine ligase cab2 [Mycoemilia scoparia]
MPPISEQNRQPSTTSLSSKGDKVIDPSTYFSTHVPPSNLNASKILVSEFVSKNSKINRPVVLVTSGGTTVPLENNTVRFIDNFSNGNRGAASTERLLEEGYAVIFMHREHSLQPYNRHYTHSAERFLDYFVAGENGEVQINLKYKEKIQTDFEKYSKAINNNQLLMVTFVTLSDYLFLLREVSLTLAAMKRNAMFYLAAAVSDFFIPSHNMSEHKIQSREGNLTLEMNQVPKFLKPLVMNWAPDSYIVSFKLETDPELLVPKARHALSNYGHQIVIANMLHTRKTEVWLIEDKKESHHLQLDSKEAANGVDIELLIIQELVKRHKEWINKN